MSHQPDVFPELKPPPGFKVNRQSEMFVIIKNRFQIKLAPAAGSPIGKTYYFFTPCDAHLNWKPYKNAS
jgi:hypothetical protein